MVDLLNAILSGDEEKKKQAYKIGRIQKEIAKRGVGSVLDWPEKRDDITEENVKTAIREMEEEFDIDF